MENAFEAMTEEQLQQIAGGIDENGNLSDEACKRINITIPHLHVAYGGPIPNDIATPITRKKQGQPTIADPLDTKE